MPDGQDTPAQSRDVSWEVDWEFPDVVERSWTRDGTHNPYPTVPMSLALLSNSFDNKRRSVVVNGWAYYMAVPPNFPEMTPEEYGERGGAQAWFEVCLPIAREIGATLRGRDYASMPTTDLAGLLPQIKVESADMTRQTFRTVGRMTEDFQELVDFCAEHFGNAGEARPMELSHGAPNETAAFGEELDRLADFARERPALAAALRGGEFDDLSGLGGGSDFESRLADVLETAGWRASSWGQIERTTMAEDPSLARKLIAGYLDAGDGAPQAARRRALAAAQDRLAQCLTQLGADHGDELQRLVELGQGYNAARESRAFWQLLAGGLPRIPLLELGRRLAEKQVLAKPADIFYLDLEQATRAAAGDFPEARELAAETRQSYELWATLDAPPFVGAPPPPFPDELRERFVSMFGQPVDQDGGEGVLKGIAASSGVAEGIARVIGSLDEIERLAPGDVLVCKSTAPPWTPLFGIASAVVTDAGGVQSHTAIVAREFAIPCVVSTADETRRIPDGARVRVDGGDGTVTLL